MIVSVQRLLGIKVCTGDTAGGIIYGKMQVPDLTGNPFMGRGIHLLEFAKVCGPGASGMGILDCNKSGLDEGGFFLGFCLFFLDFQCFFYPLFLGFCGLGREDIFAFEYTGYRGRGRGNSFLSV